MMALMAGPALVEGLDAPEVVVDQRAAGEPSGLHRGVRLAMVSSSNASGLKYINIPVVYREPTDAQVDEFLKITDDPANRPMFIHCTAAIRVGAFWLIRRVVRDGMTWDAALAEARKVGLVNAPHLEEFARGYLERRKKL
jgi:protein tyrosine phosphatase (PTP) superfamily phosphohydrolase (DUF442 family)